MDASDAPESFRGLLLRHRGRTGLWAPASARLLASLQGHTAPVRGIAVSGDGRLVVSGGEDGTIRLWDTVSGATVHTLRSDRDYERLDITGLTGVTQAQRAALIALGAIEHTPQPAAARAI